MVLMRRVAVATLVVLASGLGPAADDSTDSLEGFAILMFEAIGTVSRPCTNPDKIDHRFCAAAGIGSSKFEKAWEAGIERVAQSHAIEPVSDWHSKKFLRWRYYVVDGQPIVVDLNTKSNGVQILGSAVPRCESSVEDGTFEIVGEDGEATAPEVKYSTIYAWPFRAHLAKLSGKVKLIGIVNAAGHVTDLCIDTLDPPIVDLGQSAVKSLRKWKFRPALVGGKPADVRVPFNFDLDPKNAIEVESF